MLNDVRVMICGKEYKLKTSESPSYVYSLAKTLEEKINRLANNGSSPYSASIMVALSILDDLNKANETCLNPKSLSWKITQNLKNLKTVFNEQIFTGNIGSRRKL